MTPRYPEVFVQVADGASLATILERVDTAMRRAGVTTAARHEFKGGVPHGYTDGRLCETVGRDRLM
jgi:hypothetical protein